MLAPKGTGTPEKGAEKERGKVKKLRRTVVTIPFSQWANRSRTRHRTSSVHVLCETLHVRTTMIASGKSRFLQIRSKRGGPWDRNEAHVQCKEACPARQPSPVAAATACTPCPCTPVYPPDWSLYGFGYVQIMFDTLTQRDVRCRDRQSAASGGEPFRLLQVGLGGGGFAMHARRKCNATIDIIEADPDVVTVARRFFGFPPDESGGRLLVSDGLAGVRSLVGNGTSGVRYDAIAIDCMVQGSTPTGCKSAEFVRYVASLLRPRGAISQWAWGADRQTLLHAYREHFSDVTEAAYSRVFTGAVIRVRGPLR